MNLHRRVGGAALALCLTLAPGAPWAQEESAGRVLLFDRLGGLAPISVVVSDFIDALVADELLNANPAIDEARRRVPAAYLKYRLTSLVCETTGGPCRYQGRSMRASHAELHITEAEWEHTIGVLRALLAEHRVPDAEAQELLAIVGSTREEIVTVRDAP